MLLKKKAGHYHLWRRFVMDAERMKDMNQIKLRDEAMMEKFGIFLLNDTETTVILDHYVISKLHKQISKLYIQDSTNILLIDSSDTCHMYEIPKDNEFYVLIYSRNILGESVKCCHVVNGVGYQLLDHTMMERASIAFQALEDMIIHKGFIEPMKDR